MSHSIFRFVFLLILLSTSVAIATPRGELDAQNIIARRMALYLEEAAPAGLGLEADAIIVARPGILNLQVDNIKPSLAWIKSRLKISSEAPTKARLEQILRANPYILGRPRAQLEENFMWLVDYVGVPLAREIAEREPRLLTYSTEILDTKVAWFVSKGADISTLLMQSPGIFCYGLLVNLQKSFTALNRGFGISAREIFQHTSLLTRNTTRVLSLVREAAQRGVVLRDLDPVLKRHLIAHAYPIDMGAIVTNWNAHRCEYVSAKD